MILNGACNELDDGDLARRGGAGALRERRVKDEIIEQGPGYTIAITDEAGTLTNYSACVRPDGSINHGFLDLRDQPELVERVPEAAKSEGLAEILRVANSKGSPFFTIG